METRFFALLTVICTCSLMVIGAAESINDILPNIRVSRQIKFLGNFGGKAIPGEAGQDYPVFASVPATSFSCRNQPFNGYYADVDAQCQVFHICQEGGRQDSFLCPNGTIFNQKYFVCDWYFKVDCAKSADYFFRNAGIGQPFQPVVPFEIGVRFSAPSGLDPAQN